MTFENDGNNKLIMMLFLALYFLFFLCISFVWHSVENQSDEDKCLIDSNKSSSSNSNSPLFVSSSSLCDSNSSYANQVDSFPQTVPTLGESENTTHSYSNSLLEDEDDIDIMMSFDDFDTEREGDEEVHLIPHFDALKLSDLNNGKELTDWIHIFYHLVIWFTLNSLPRGFTSSFIILEKCNFDYFHIFFLHFHRKLSANII